MNSHNSTIFILKALTISFCFAFIFIQSVNAQSQKGPTLTADNTSLQLGDTFVFHYCTTNIFDTSHSGENQVWDYSYLTDSVYNGTPVIDGQKCVDPKQTLYGDSFPNASFATTHTIPTGVNPHNDYWSGNTSYYYWGYYAGLTHVIYKTPPAEIPLYPVSYGSNSYIGSYNFTDLPYTGIDSSYADGYGTLILPDTTFQNVLRIKTILIDSTPATTPGLIFTRRLVAYYFFTPNYHANILALQDGFTFYTLNGVRQSAFSAEARIIYRASNTNEVLPLQLISFSASLKDRNVAINWQTATESNTSYFNILRSIDGNNFKSIGKSSAAGNSSVIKNYSYTDVNATALNVSKVYYRIQEVDKDGKSNYSNIKTVNLSNPHSLFSVSPNPSKDFINIVSSGNVVNAKLKITDISGRTLYTSKQNFIAGQQMKISLSQFPSEVLIVTIANNDSHEQFKIIKE